MKKILVIAMLLSLSACTESKQEVVNENTIDKIDSIEKTSLDVKSIKRIDEKQQKDSTKQTENDRVNNNLINKNINNMSQAIITTSEGDITISLNSDKAPISVENFKKYASEGYFDGTIFHRVMPGFMIQGGGFDEEGKEKLTKDPIKNEAQNGFSNKRGTLAMARTQIVDSATSQFFINLVDNDFLNYSDEANYGYAVFAEVIEGMDVVDKIAGVETGQNGPHANWPKENVLIESVKLIK